MSGYRPGRLSWRHLDQEQAQALWVELIDWVEWFRGCYRLTDRVKGCWYRHPKMVEELTAAMSAHKVAYEQLAEEATHSWSPGSWHYQVYMPLLQRLAANSEEFADCIDGNCEPPKVQVKLFDGVQEWIASDIAARPTPIAAAVAASGSLPDSATGAGSAVIDAARIVDLIDSGEAEPVDPDDEFGPVSYGVAVASAGNRADLAYPTGGHGVSSSACTVDWLVLDCR
ncbi:hypothetical protein ACFWCF_17430 [Rhodococcus sp. NPDC060090]|uniref:hypothetical protein n=1 Tax=Rhodococcus sp. NPDC060090 TaxID=3347056 RepID=UPI00364E814A